MKVLPEEEAHKVSAVPPPERPANREPERPSSRTSWSESARARAKSKTMMGSHSHDETTTDEFDVGEHFLDEHPDSSYEPLKQPDVPHPKHMTLHLPVLPCWDENDDGVPPMCAGEPTWWKVFNHDHKLTNFNPVCMVFGNVGFSWYDERRKKFMALAMWSTLLSIGFTVYGCFAISRNLDIIKRCHWFRVRVNHVGNFDGPLDHFTLHGHSSVYVGLSSLVVEAEPCTVTGCQETNLHYLDYSHWNNTFLEENMRDCRDTANAFVFGAFVTCATLGFALLGTMNRMKFASDAPIQKALGMITDLCGFVSLFHTLYTMANSCLTELNDGRFGGLHVVVHAGPGFYCYMICLFGAAMRVLGHWLTPLPGQGSGCACKVPEHLRHVLDVDGDGKLTHKDLIAAFRRSRHDTSFVKRLAHARAVQRDHATIRAHQLRTYASLPVRMVQSSGVAASHLAARLATPPVDYLRRMSPHLHGRHHAPQGLDGTEPPPPDPEDPAVLNEQPRPGVLVSGTGGGGGGAAVPSESQGALPHANGGGGEPGDGSAEKKQG